jgi:hypothetical protein
MPVPDIRDRLILIKNDLAKAGGGGDNGGMDDVLRRVTALEGDMKALAKDVAEIKGKLSNMPTTFQMATWFLGVAIGLTSLVFAIAKVTSAH